MKNIDHKFHLFSKANFEHIQVRFLNKLRILLLILASLGTSLSFEASASFCEQGKSGTEDHNTTRGRTRS